MCGLCLCVNEGTSQPAPPRPPPSHCICMRSLCMLLRLLNEPLALTETVPWPLRKIVTICGRNERKTEKRVQTTFCPSHFKMNVTVRNGEFKPIVTWLSSICARVSTVFGSSPHMASVAIPTAHHCHWQPPPASWQAGRLTFSAGTNMERPSLWLTSKLCLASSGRTRGEMEQLVLMKQLQDTNYYVNVLLLSSATANSLLHLEVQRLLHTCVWVSVCVRACSFQLGEKTDIFHQAALCFTGMCWNVKRATKRRLLSLNVRYINSHNAQRK